MCAMMRDLPRSTHNEMNQNHTLSGSRFVHLSKWYCVYSRDNNNYLIVKKIETTTSHHQ